MQLIYIHGNRHVTRWFWDQQSHPERWLSSVCCVSNRPFRSDGETTELPFRDLRGGYKDRRSATQGHVDVRTIFRCEDSWSRREPIDIERSREYGNDALVSSGPLKGKYATGSGVHNV